MTVRQVNRGGVPLSGPVQFQHVNVGDVLYKIFDGQQAGTRLGEVVEITTNSKGNRVVVLDRVCELGSNRLAAKAFNLRIRKAIAEH